MSGCALRSCFDLAVELVHVGHHLLLQLPEVRLEAFALVRESLLELLCNLARADRFSSKLLLRTIRMKEEYDH